MKNNQYVYQLIDPRNKKPFYIGEGKNNRAWSHQIFKSGCNNPHKDRTIQNIHNAGLEVEVKLLFQNLSKQESILIEERLIEEIGIENLTNICKNANPPVKCGVENGFYGKTHSEETKIVCGNVNRGKDIKTAQGKKSISISMKDRWKDPVKRENQINALKSRRGEKRSPEAIESYKKSAAARNEAMTPEARSARTRAGCETKKIKYAGLTREKYIDDSGKIRYKWVPVAV